MAPIIKLVVPSQRDRSVDTTDLDDRQCEEGKGVSLETGKRNAKTTKSNKRKRDGAPQPPATPTKKRCVAPSVGAPSARASKVYPSEQSRAITQSLDVASAARLMLDRLSEEDGVLFTPLDKLVAALGRVDAKLADSNVAKLVAPR